MQKQQYFTLNMSCLGIRNGQRSAFLSFFCPFFFPIDFLWSSQPKGLMYNVELQSMDTKPLIYNAGPQTLQQHFSFSLSCKSLLLVLFSCPRLRPSCRQYSSQWMQRRDSSQRRQASTLTYVTLETCWLYNKPFFNKKGNIEMSFHLL